MTSNPQIAPEKTGPEPLVWYAGYGSNLDMARLACYIQGGTPEGTTQTYLGCEDPSPPLANAAFEIPHPLYFAGDSLVWNGGVAFIGHEAADKDNHTKASAYLIRLAQLEQIVALESRREEVLPVDVHQLRTLGRTTLGDGSGKYDEMVYCGELGEYPVLSFTSPTGHPTFNKPSAAYLRIMASGLSSTHHLNLAATVDYLIQKPGVAGNYSEPQLFRILG